MLLIGRKIAEDQINPHDDRIVCEAGEVITIKLLMMLFNAGIEVIVVDKL